MLALTGGDNLADVFAVTAIRPKADTAPRQGNGRRL